MGAGSTLTFKRYYNKGRGLLEPVWGDYVKGLQCPTCGSKDMRFSGSPDDPEEIFGAAGMVRCTHCGRITDWYEANKQAENHPCDKPRKVVKG
jgi:endogenous inhibitor of DNA gyrase (YacG/DUF329 family)